MAKERRTGLVFSDRYLQHNTNPLRLPTSGQPLPFVEPIDHYSNPRLAERTKKQVTVRIFSNAQLGNERDLIEGLQIGTVQMTIAANAPISRYSPKVLLFDLPFLFRDDAHWDKVVDGPIGKEVGDEFVQFGFRSLGYLDGGIFVG